jgi:glycosyltransferase involved in cell wall biosynthesis
MTVHLVYPHKNSISAPNVIGFKLAEELRKYFDVVTYNWDSVRMITPKAGDVLIGHPHPFPFTIFRRSVEQSGWARKIIMAPFNADWNQSGFIDNFIDKCDLFLAITGDYWFERIASAKASRWLPKMVQLNLAVDRKQFPNLKESFNPAGNRKFIYIGNDHPGKNLPYLREIASQLGSYEFAWAGRGGPCPELKSLGYVDFSLPESRRLISGYDFMITVGSADANPTTILEALAWGLIPVCTPTSGYQNEFGIVNIPLNDVNKACAMIEELQAMDLNELGQICDAGKRLLTEKYNWQIFFDKVLNAINRKDSPLISDRKFNNDSHRTVNGARMFAKLIVNNLSDLLGGRRQ